MFLWFSDYGLGIRNQRPNLAPEGLTQAVWTAREALAEPRPYYAPQLLPPCRQAKTWGNGSEQQRGSKERLCQPLLLLKTGLKEALPEVLGCMESVNCAQLQICFLLNIRLSPWNIACKEVMMPMLNRMLAFCSSVQLVNATEYFNIFYWISFCWCGNMHSLYPYINPVACFYNLGY